MVPPVIPAGFEPYDRPGSAFHRLIGPIHIRERDGDVRFGLRAEAEHGNGRSVHGGLLLGLADEVFGYAVRQASGGPAATVSLHCDFLSAAMPGDWIEATAAVTRMTGGLVFVGGTIETAGRMLLTGSGVWKRLRAPLEREPTT